MALTPKQRSIAAGILNAVGGVLDFAEIVNKKKDPLRAVQKAIKKARKRKAAIDASLDTFAAVLDDAKKLKRDYEDTAAASSGVKTVCPHCRRRAILHFDPRTDICTGCDKCEGRKGRTIKVVPTPPSLFCACCGLPPAQCHNRAEKTG